MQYRRLGGSGLRVSLLALGGNTFGRHFQFGTHNDATQTRVLIERAADLGVNLIDTADMYSGGESERYIGRAVAGQRERWLIASKAGMPACDGPDAGGLSRRHILRSVEGSLRRLGTDYLDLYYAHRPDPETPIDETLRALDDLVTQGKIRYAACSNFAAWQIAQACETAARRGYVPLVASQSPYNLLEREIEAEVVPCCQAYGVGIAAYWPLAQGVLAGKYQPGQPAPAGTRGWNNPSQALARQRSDRNLARAQALGAWAEARGRTLAELAIAWVAARPGVACVITGVTSAAQLEANARAAAWELSAEDVAAVDAIALGRQDA